LQISRDKLFQPLYRRANNQLPVMIQTLDELNDIAVKTLKHYEQRAQDFWEGTRDHDVSQNVAALLQYIETPPPFDVLDFGCGPGRDLMAFKRLGIARPA
jgi:SAM-dependent methyltransferase